MVFCFVSVSKANYFMTELLSMVCSAVKAHGHTVDLVFDEFPELSAEGVYVVIPHEFHAHQSPPSFPTASQCARTIALCTENPGTPWFEHTARLLPYFAAAFAINRGSVRELSRRGLSCEHLQLGYSPLWDTWRRDENSPRPIDLLYLGATDVRRDPILASYGRHLWNRHYEFLVPLSECRTSPRADYLTGIQKHHRLRATQLLLNLHRSSSASMEWVRFLEATCNGCVLLSEPCIDHEPLVPGEHFLAATAENLAIVADRLLDDPDRLRRVRLEAYDYVRERLQMSPSVERLAEVAAEKIKRAGVRSDAAPGAGARQTSPLPDHPEAPPPAILTPEAQALQTIGQALRALSIETSELRRDLADIAHRQRTGHAPDPDVYLRTPAYADAVPRVTVLMSVFNAARDIIEALEGVAVSRSGIVEILLLDDASTDGSADAAAGFLEAHDWLPATLMRHPTNRGLARSRNALLEHARGAYVFILDASVCIYPTALPRLTAALDADDDATFAYSMVGGFRDGGPAKLISGLPWEPERLRRGNYIDGPAMIRRLDLTELGGYVTDPRLTGWEDFHLWCKCAESERRGVLVPQVLASCQLRANAIDNGSEIDTTRAWSLMRKRFPALLGDERLTSAAS